MLKYQKSLAIKRFT